MDSEQEAKVHMVMDFTKLSHSEAEALLAKSSWDVSVAINKVVEQTKDRQKTDKPKASSSSSSKFATLSTNNDSDEDEDDEEGQEFFAGGKASGVAIKGPTKKTKEVVGGILKKAEETGRKELEEGLPEPKKKKQPFKGKGYKLGTNEDGQEEVYEEEEEQEQDSSEPAQISLTFWQEGFSIDDGPLRPYTDPANREFLMDINRGIIPREIQTKHGQEVRLLISKRLEEKYVPPKKAVKPFSGSGQRLGSVVPGEPLPQAGEILPAQIMTPIASSSPVPSTTVSSPPDPSMTTIQIRLADGTKLVLKISQNETISEIRRFINMSRAGESSRNYVLMTTFPNKELQDETLTIKQASLANSVVVQRYK